MKYLSSALATLIFILALGITYYIHVSYFRVNVVFYAAILDGIIATAITAIVIFSIRHFKVLNSFEKVQLIAIWLLGGYAFAISVPTVIDRSLSFYILEKLQQRGGAIKQESFEQIFVKEYVKEHRLVDVRLTEQLESGTIEIKDSCVVLTEKGNMIASFGRYFRKNWLPKERLLMGEYSDDLTDPFRKSAQSTNYTCKRDINP